MSKSKLAVGAATVAAAAGALFFTARTARKAEALVPRDGRMVEVDGQQLHVAEEGAGPPLLLIHGLGGQMRNFSRDLVDDLARDYRVIRVDRPGSGYSPRAAGTSADLRTQARLIAGLIDELGLEKPWLVGHSLGGALALTVAVLHPDKVGGLLLIAPVSQPVAEVSKVFKRLMVPPRMRGVIAHSIAVPMAILTSQAVMSEVFGPEPVPEDFAVAGGGALGMRPSAFIGASADLAEAGTGMEDVVAGYADLTLPTHILFARGDALLDYRDHGERTAREIPGARLTLVEGGHMLPFTQARETAQWIRQSIEGGANG
ncbi:MAG: alpha/beta hydrolase [Sphingomonas bacterium]|nr:alpha/beta hydrolase [Sphingomonas bacterium]